MTYPINIILPGNAQIVLTIPELQARPSTDLVHGSSVTVGGDSAFADGSGGLWTWDSNSLGVDDGYVTIRPDDRETLQAGRWIKIDSDVHASIASLSADIDALETSIDAISLNLAAPTGSNLVGSIQTGTGAVARTAQSKLRDIVSVKDYGANPAATATANVAAFNAAATAAGTYGSIVVPFGTYALNGTVDILAGQQWRFEGSVITQSADVATLRADDVDGWSIGGNLKIVGDRSGGVYTDSGQVGLLVANSVRFKVGGVTCDNIAGAGFRQTSSEVATLRGEGGSYSDCAAFSCAIGRQLVAGSKSEFSSWTNWTASGNGVGDDISAGNVSTNGGSVSSNVDIGVKLTSGINDGHGGYSNVTIAHNGNYQLYASGVQNGYLFNGCRFYEGTIALIGCNAITIQNGILDVPNLYNRLNGSSLSIGTNRIVGNYCPGGYGSIDIKRSEPQYDKHLDVLDCFGPGSFFSGITINDPSPAYVHARRIAGGGTQAITGATTLIFPSVQQNGNRKALLNEATGVITAETAGQYRVRAHLVFTVTNSTTAGSYVTLLINGTGGEVFTLGLFSTTILEATVERDIYCSAGDTMALQATLNGTSPAFGHASFISWISVERIA